nr:retrovirus-related Pol polyprotein from transposon TNT 1-94 [Tanacetum cinerariifolium]
MDVKSSFLYGKIKKELYVYKPPRFKDPDFPNKVYKVEKALYRLHQVPRALYETLLTYLLDNRFQREKIDKIMFIKRHKGDILSVQVYVDDIIFGSTKKELCISFEKLMHDKFQMNFMRELTFFLGLQVKQKKEGIFISQDTYVAKILKKFGFFEVKTTSTPMETQTPLLKDKDGKEVDCKKKIMVAKSTTEAEHKLMLLGKLTTARVNAVQGRFIQTFLDKQLSGLPTHKEKYDVSFYTKKVFANMKRIGKGFYGKETPLFPTMVGPNQVQMGEGGYIQTREDTSKQGRIDEIDANEDIALVSKHDDVGTHDNIVQDEGIEYVGNEEVVKVVTTANMIIDVVVDVVHVTTVITDISVSAAKTIVTTALTITVESKKINVKVTQAPKSKGVMIQSQRKQQQQKQFLHNNLRADIELAEKLQAKIDEEDRLAKERAQNEQEANDALINTWDDIQAKIDEAAASWDLGQMHMGRSGLGVGTVP